MRTERANVARCAVAASTSSVRRASRTSRVLSFALGLSLAWGLAWEPASNSACGAPQPSACASSPPCDVSLWMSGMGTTPGFRWSSGECGSSGGVQAAVMMVEGGAPVVYATGCFSSVLD